MKEKNLPEHRPLSAQEMRVIGENRLTINDYTHTCSASFECYDGSVVHCSGVIHTCTGVKTTNMNDEYIIGVNCNGSVHVCSNPFPSRPIGSGATCENLKKVACVGKKHKAGCSYSCNGVVTSGTCLYNPMAWPGSEYLFCSTGYGTKNE